MRRIVGPLGHFKKEYEERDVSMDKDPYNSLLVVTSCERKQSSVCNDACLPASIGSSAKITKELLLCLLSRSHETRSERTN